MAQFEPSRILDRGEADSVQQYVEIGANTYLGTKDGMKYALIPTSDNKFKLCELPCESSMSLNASKTLWYPSPAEENSVEESVTPASGCRAIKVVAVRKEPTPCKGQGDESGNSIILTPGSASSFKDVNNNVSGEISDSLDRNQIHLEESPQLTYTTLVPKQENIVDVTSVSYALPQDSFFQIPQAQLTPLSSKPTRFVKPRQRMQVPRGNHPYPAISPIPHATRGHRQRKPRQVWYQYKNPVLQSTPTSMSSPSSSLGSGETTRNSSITSSEESQVSLEYPRVPNNTPTSEEERLENKQKLDLQQWIPQIQSDIDNFVDATMQMDPRESHNEKERKRRLRIKNACQSMKSLLPCICDKTDNATVFENAVHFIAFMRETVGIDYDMEFLEQTCMY